MRATKVPEGGSKKKLLDAAEVLVAAKGFDSVSVRDVTGAASANVAAVNYHFGSREGLMDMVIVRILDPLCEVRNKAFDGLGKTPSAEALIRAYVSALPQVEEITGMDGGIFPRLAGRILALSDEAIPPVLAAARREVGTRYSEAVTRTSDAKPTDWVFFEAGIAQSLIGVANSRIMAGLLGEWIAFGTRAMASAAGGSKKKEDAQGMLFDL